MLTSVYTVCDVRFLPRALVLAKSLKDICNIDLVIFIGQDDLSNLPKSIIKEYDIRTIRDQQIERFNELSFKYEMDEFLAAVRPVLALKLLEKSKKVIFLDPDIKVFSKLNNIESELDKYSVLLTPHYNTPEDFDPMLDDAGMMKFGCYNLGFFGVNNSQESKDFLSWWYKRLMENCVKESHHGFSVDQRWVSISTCFFENIKVSFNLGLNVAFWNLHERKLTKNDGHYYVNEKSPLTFFHFSSFDRNKPEILSKRQIKVDMELVHNNKTIQEICKEYAEELNYITNLFTGIDMDYPYDYFDNGRYITPLLRKAYAARINEFKDVENPHCADSAVYRFAEINRLFSKNDKIFSVAGYSDLESNRWKIKLINIFQKFILLLYGPNFFFNYSTRLLIYLSNIRMQREFWKIPNK